jgi:SAM-dependent methyltransferase
VDLAKARELFGYQTIQADGSDKLPFGDDEFDLIFCSSVLEHVTGPKEEIINLANGSRFRETAFSFQKTFAAEIRRIGKRYYVQTPHRYFMVESHTWLPFPIVLLPRPLQIRTIKLFNKFWPKRTEPDWNLLVPSQVRALFPDADILVERVAGWPKSIMAIKR